MLVKNALFNTSYSQNKSCQNTNQNYILKQTFVNTPKSNLPINFKSVTEFAKDKLNSIKDFGSDTLSAVQNLFNKKKDTLSPKEVDFLTKYTTKENEIKEKYQKELDEIKDTFWDNYFDISGKKRKKIKEKMEAHLRGIDDMREAFEEEEKEFLEFRRHYRGLAENLNLSKEVISAIMKDEETNVKRQAINARKKSFADDYGLKKIAGYDDEIRKLHIKFIDKVDDEKAGKYLKKPIINSMLFYGPTGCGKTTFAKALAEETDCRFEEIKIRGLSQASKEKAFKEQYEQIALEAQENFENDNIRTIVLLDEADRFFNKNTSSTFVSYMKELMDTCSEDEHITLFLTTNDPLKFPYELRSPKRIGLLVSLDPPNKKNTIDVLKYYFRDSNIENIDFEKVYTKLEEIKPSVYSNTHLKSISDLAFELSKNEDEEVNTDLIIRAVDKYNNLYDNPELRSITKSYIDKYLEEQQIIGNTQCSE